MGVKMPQGQGQGEREAPAHRPGARWEGGSSTSKERGFWRIEKPSSMAVRGQNERYGEERGIHGIDAVAAGRRRRQRWLTVQQAKRVTVMMKDRSPEMLMNADTWGGDDDSNDSTVLIASPLVVTTVASLDLRCRTLISSKTQCGMF
ncbi:hypothetical protein NM208_g16738 [Fusarium decemcellulare]|uniref:Uncharacterized protein n=1 Tax=Fusarium decemcellulare TaxID=57161 RepID=A0ACC1R9G7_9HYPO|nr:hypothetical protein NM208_g16738 [Fusarium decemcellulare]